jgi:light-regulated signal transduction histidine kinase (bacteriophytochrome)
VVARVETALRLQKIRSEARAQVEAVNAELQRANQDLEQFAYSASHDLQEPLRSVKIYSELLTANCEDQLAGNGSEYLKFVREGASRMEVLLRDMLAYARASRMDAPAERIDAGACLQASLDSLAAAISESGAEITADPLPEVMVHEAHLQQIYQNLIGNAIKYRRTGVVPQIHIAAEAKDAECVFSVRDNGIGIDPEYFNRIFGLFKRLHTKQEYSGTGIGLALCQRIVEHYRGRIWVESQPGSGSTFYFALPV